MMFWSWIAALAIAALHYRILSCLNRKRDIDTISQSWATNFSTVLARLVSFFLGYSLLAAFPPLLWKSLQASSQTVETIDCMLALQTGLMGLQHKKVWRVSKPICLTALMLQGTLVATSFPPGALAVSSMPGANDSVREMTNHALFQMWYGDAYRSPRFSLNKLVKANIHGGQYTPTTNPCGSNCTYEVTIQGPAFECKEGITSDLRTLTTEYYGNKSTTPLTTTEFNPKLVNYLAAINGSALYHNSSAVFEIQYANGTFGAYEVPPLSSLSCTAWYADYTFEISYSNGVQSVIAQANKTNVITDTVLSGS